MLPCLRFFFVCAAGLSKVLIHLPLRHLQVDVVKFLLSCVSKIDPDNGQKVSVQGT
jgi:hypothetical protein